jgi:hypothetical protein
MSGVIDLFILYQFIKRLATPFNEWDAYKYGIIDEKGNILKNARERRNIIKERESFTKFDLLVLKLKKLLEKIPGGATRFGSYAAALWLIKEGIDVDGTLIESAEPSMDDIMEYMEYSESEILNDDLEKYIDEVMSAGAGAVAGIGIGDKGEPGVHPKKRKGIPPVIMRKGHAHTDKKKYSRKRKQPAENRFKI